MAEDIEQRLAATAEALREHELAQARVAELSRTLNELIEQLSALRARHAEEQRDVERLEGLSLTRVLASLRGSRDDQLDRERAEADAAHYRVRDAEARIEAVRRAVEQATARQAELAGAPASYAALLDEQEALLRATSDPRSGQLLALAAERGRLTGELTEITEAQRAAAAASAALAEVARQLDRASGWSTYDTFFGGGAISSAIKHSRLDEAAEAAAHADRCLAVLHTELADVGGVELTSPQLMVRNSTRFIDIFFDNIFTDLSVRDQIKQAQQNVEHSSQLVAQVSGQLTERANRSRTRLAEIESQRRGLLDPGEPADSSS